MYQASLKSILAVEQELHKSYSLHAPSALKAGDVVVHNMIKKFGESETRALCNLMRLTNAHHLVSSKCGGYACVSGCGSGFVAVCMRELLAGQRPPACPLPGGTPL
jgi:hypothetical protein